MDHRDDENNPFLHLPEEALREVRLDVAYKCLSIVNVVFVGLPGSSAWVLIDTGIPGMAGVIEDVARERFGRESRPAAILLTHGHFDHAGNAGYLANKWRVPVYAHALEIPFLDGSASYSYGEEELKREEGLSSLISSAHLDLRPWLQAFPENGFIPGVRNWSWVATPGHSPGHVSFWRESDRILISGDAVLTTRPESAYTVALRQPEIHGPPYLFTMDWEEAARSVEELSGLEPELIIPGHGAALKGQGMRDALAALTLGARREGRQPENVQRVSAYCSKLAKPRWRIRKNGSQACPGMPVDA